MLYIDKLDTGTFRFGSEAAGAGDNKFYPISLQARGDEWDRIWIEHKQTLENVLNVAEVDKITLDGVVHPTVAAFVQAFNLAAGVTA